MKLNGFLFLFQMNRPSMQQSSHEHHQQQPGGGFEEQTSPPLPPTSTHPLHKPPGQPKMPPVGAAAATQFNYVASNAEPPKVAFYQAQSTTAAAAAAAPANNKAGNPWEREEREKEQEMRRDQMRHWRDQQIAELSSVPRTGQQEEQLKTLILERDFERRAQMEQQEEEQQQQGDNVMTNGGGVVEVAKEQSGEMVLSPNLLATTMQPKSILKHNTGAPLNDASGSSGSMGSPSHSNQASPMKQPPKTASFSDQVIAHRHLSFDGTDQMNNNPVLSQLTKEMAQLGMEGGTATATMEMQYSQQMYQQQELYPEYPPPPPERNSSYVFMSQQQQKLRTQQLQKQQQQQQQMMIETNNNNNHLSNGGAANGQGYVNGGPISPTGATTTTTTTTGYANGGGGVGNNGNFMIPPPANFNSHLVRGDSKRVSFHDEDNNNGVMAGDGGGYMGATSGGAEMSIREDPDVSEGRMGVDGEGEGFNW